MNDVKGEATNGALTYMEYGIDEKGVIDKAVKEPPITLYDNPSEHAPEIVGKDPVVIKLVEAREKESR